MSTDRPLNLKEPPAGRSGSRMEGPHHPLVIDRRSRAHLTSFSRWVTEQTPSRGVPGRTVTSGCRERRCCVGPSLPMPEHDRDAALVQTVITRSSKATQSWCRRGVSVAMS